MFIIIGIEALLYMLHIIVSLIVAIYLIDWAINDYKKKQYIWPTLFFIVGILHIFKIYNLLLEIFM